MRARFAGAVVVLVGVASCGAAACAGGGDGTSRRAERRGDGGATVVTSAATRADAPGTTRPPRRSTTSAAPATPPTPVVASTATAPLAMPDGVDGPFDVVDVVDGDTIKVSAAGGVVTVRLIGIDTPETVDPREPVQCFGREASARAHALLDGASVWLEYDATQGSTDRYGRTLAYVWLADGTLVNEAMIRDGYAHEYTYEIPYRYQERFDAAEALARATDAGLWSPDACAGDTSQPADPLSLVPPPPPAVTPAPAAGCDPNYAGACVPIVGRDLDCADISGSVTVVGTDVHRFDGDGDGVGCEG